MAWFTRWALQIAYLGYALTSGAHDSVILPHRLIGAVELPVLLLASAPAFFRARPALQARAARARALSV